jgi:hypothetical protein
MKVKLLELLAVLLIAISMAGGWAHLMSLPHKMVLSREQYLTVQQIYRGWALLGVPIIGGIVATVALAALRRGQGATFYFALAAAACVALGLGVFFAFTFPTNLATQNWPVLPVDGWQSLRRQWEYSHAAGAVLYFMALASLTLSIILRRRG